jgi:dolichol-phosphate mannosyltransferase
VPADIWLIIPTYNEAVNLERIVTAARAELARAAAGSFRILVVDDNSPDGTGAIADSLAQDGDDLEVLHRPGKAGLGQAYLAGFDRALRNGAQLVIEMDADFSHDPRYLPTLLEASRSADLVLGSRYVAGGGTRNWGLLRRAISRGGSLYTAFFLRMGVKDPTGGFKCFRRSVLEQLDLDAIAPRGYVFQIETTYRVKELGLRVVELPITFVDRVVGTSKMSRSVVIEAVWRVPLLRFRS